MRGRHATVHGTGLIGASIGLGLRGQGWEVAGWDPDPAALDQALRRGAITEALGSPTRGPEEPDLLVLAGPPGATAEALRGLRTDTLVTDVSGVKASIVAAAAHLPHFVGGHPMAGGASSGAALASSNLFHGATWILTSDNTDRSDLDEMASLVRSLGANPVMMTAEEHDRSVARVSHLPHLLAASLVALAARDGEAMSLAGGGFRDLTRVADSEAGWWSEVLVANAGMVAEAMVELEAGLASWKEALQEGNTEQISAGLESARSHRSSLAGHHVQVRVVLLDRPGEIAQVGQALESSRVDVRDFQLRHGEHGGGGILSISVSPRSEEALRRALEAEGFTLQD